MWDIALKYAADWNSVKFSAAAGYSQLTDEGCSGSFSPTVTAGCTNVAVLGGGGLPHQSYRQDGQLFQIGASIMHVPSGLFVYGLYQNDREEGSQFRNFNFNTGRVGGSADANDSNTWFVKAGIKRTWSPVGATVIWGEWGQYNDMYRGLCGLPTGSVQNGNANVCEASLVTGVDSNGDAITTDAIVTGSQVNRYGVGIVQEVDSAAMHLFARWQHLDLDLDAKNFTDSNKFGNNLRTSFDGQEIFQIGGVIFF
jgi:hypothetical protein